MKLIAQAAQIEEEQILGHDLFLYNRQKGCIWGASDEYISSGRLDDLQCAFASLQGFLQGRKESQAAVHCVFDNEEVGSGTKQGAAIHFSQRRTESDMRMPVHDQRRAADRHRRKLHDFRRQRPCRSSEPHGKSRSGQPALCKRRGIVIKYNADQKYCTDGVSAAFFKDLCAEADVPLQTFTNRSDMSGGSTLGNISSAQVALNTIDIGLPQLSMHSAYETAGIKRHRLSDPGSRRVFLHKKPSLYRLSGYVSII